MLDRNGWQHYTSTFAWWEVYPQYPYSEELYSLGISPNDVLHVSVQYTFSKGQVLFTVYNESSGQYSSLYVSAGGFGGYQAEWVAERPTPGGVMSYLANFGSVTFTGAEAESGGAWRGVGQEAHRCGSMYDKNRCQQQSSLPQNANAHFPRSAPGESWQRAPATRPEAAGIRRAPCRVERARGH